MKFKVICTIDIDLDKIKRDICERGCTVREAVDDYICGLDDSIYYLALRETQQILEALRKDGFED